MLVEGKWQGTWHPIQSKDSEGRFIRQSSAIRHGVDEVAIQQMRSGKHPYSLYVTYLCPWATRTLIARSLLGLEAFIPVSVLEPFAGDFGWQFGDFPGSTPASEEDFAYLHEMYACSNGNYTGRATVPVLWDNRKEVIVNNESADILRIFNRDFKSLHGNHLDLYPDDLAQSIDAFNDAIYHSLNNGVYRAGFASTQSAYHEAVDDVFNCLDRLEKHFQQHNFAVGNQITESDIRLFVTLSRFDLAYYGLFKTNRKMIKEYHHLSEYLHRLLAIEAFEKNTHVDHIKTGYYSIKALNPMRIVPEGPELDWFSFVEKNRRGEWIAD